MSGNIKTRDETIYGYLSALDAVIPTYQRSYEWGSDQVGDFLMDLMTEAENTYNPESMYFFGPIITTKENEYGRKQIIDGQQRLTTSTIFLAVLRDLLGEFTHSETAQDIKHIIKNDLIGVGSEYKNFKLTQVGSIETEFRKEIQEYNPNRGAQKKKIITGHGSKGKGKVNNIFRAYNQILETLENHIEFLMTDDEKVKVLKNIFDVFTKQFFIVEISSPNRTEAFQIFQTINARGLDLSASDLIKSDFFGNSGQYTEQVITNWNEIQKNLGDLNMSEFIRYTWNSSHGFSQKRGLYKAVSISIKEPSQVNNFVTMLLKLSIPYAEMHGDMSAVHLTDSENGKKIKNSLEELKALNFKIFAPLYLVMINKEFTEDNIYKVIHKVMSLLVRNKIMGRGTNWLEKKFSTEAIRIFNSTDNENKVVMESLSILDDSKESDEHVSVALKHLDYANELPLARFILRSIENNNQGEKEFLSTDNKKVHIEHILPQNPKEESDWSFPSELYSKYLWQIGNLTLWLGKTNSSLQNSNFDKKKKEYSKSDVLLTRCLDSYNNWSPTAIDERSNTLIKSFLRIND